jgi:hypothetical protein
MLSDTMSHPIAHLALPLYEHRLAIATVIDGHVRCVPRNRIHIRADDDDDDGGGDGDDLWKGVVLGNSFGHDAHGWKLPENEDGEKKDAL